MAIRRYTSMLGDGYGTLSNIILGGSEVGLIDVDNAAGATATMNPPTAPERISTITRFSAARSFGLLAPVTHQIVAPDGSSDSPILGDWEANEDDAGGFKGASARISAEVVLLHPDVYRAGAVWRSFCAECGECLWGGELQEPAIEGGMAQLTGLGWGDLYPERSTGYVLYQTRDYSAWNIDDRANRNGTPATNSYQNWSMGIEQNRYIADPAGNLNFHREKGAAAKSSGISAQFWARRQELSRMAFTLTWTAETAGSEAEILIEGGDDNSSWLHLAATTLTGASGSTDYDLDLTTDTGGTRRKPEWIAVTVRDRTTAFATAFEVSLISLRVNAAASGDEFTASALVRDVLGRIGVSDAHVARSEVNVLPYELRGTAGDALDYAALLAGFRGVFRDTGMRPAYDFDRYDSARYTLADPRLPFAPIALPRYDRATVVWHDTGKPNRRTQEKVRLDPSPLSEPSDYGRIEVPMFSPDETRAFEIAERLLERLAAEQWGGDAELVSVMDATGAAHSHPHAGDVVDQAPTGITGLRIGELHRSEESVRARFTDVVSIVERMIARRSKRIERRS